MSCRYCNRDIYLLYGRWLHKDGQTRGCRAADYFTDKQKWLEEITPNWWKAKP